MAHVDNLIQARAQKIALSALAPLSGPHQIPPPNHLCTKRITNPVCKESASDPALSGKSNPHRRAISDSNATAWEIFPDDQLVREKPPEGGSLNSDCESD
jgi:hypothetical protein